MKYKFIAAIISLSVLSCSSPKKEKESKTTTAVDSSKVVPTYQPVSRKPDSTARAVKPDKEEAVPTSSIKRPASRVKQPAPDLGTIPFENSTPISFREFHSRTLKSLPLIRLPLDLEQTTSKVKVHAYPRGSFDMPEGFNAERMLVGMLPDTSNYYGIVWKGYLPHAQIYSSPGKRTLTYLTTFSKSGEMISNVRLQLEFYPQGPSDCGDYKSEHHSVIEADYSFTSTQGSSFKCKGESGPRITSERIFGNIERNGVIVVHTSTL